MPFAPGTPKPARSGRKKGTLNRLTKEAGERLAELRCDPIEGLARIAADRSNSPELRGRMYAELAQYVYRKRRAVESRSVDSEGRDRFPLDIESVRAYMRAVPDDDERG